MHSEGILAGELKHGPLALIDKDMPVIMVVMRDACYTKCHNALQQVTARQVRAFQNIQKNRVSTRIFFLLARCPEGINFTRQI